MAIANVTVADTLRASARPDQTVVIAGERIVASGNSEEVDLPIGVEVVDASGRYLIPGLIDMHVHAFWHPSVPASFLPLFVANGVTTVRDMGGNLELLHQARRGLAGDSLPSPRVFAAGAILDDPEPIHPDVAIPVANVEDAETAVESLAAAGADFIKVYTLLPADAFEAIVAAADRHGLHVAGHVPREVGPVAAANAGMWTMEHGMSETGGLCVPDDDRNQCEAAVRAFRDNRTWHVPTLVMQGQTQASALCGDLRLRFLPAAVLEHWFDAKPGPENCDDLPSPPSRFEPSLPPEGRLVGILHQGGIPLLAGTDAGMPFTLPGWSLHDELRLLVEAGLSASQALRAATWEAARALGKHHEIGAIEPGYPADLVLLSGNPLQDIRSTERVEAVAVDGKWLDRDGLDAILETVAEAARRPRRVH